MLTGISTGASNSIKSFTASNAFKVAENAMQNERKDNTSSGVELNDNNILLKNIEKNIYNIIGKEKECTLTLASQNSSFINMKKFNKFKAYISSVITLLSCSL